MSLITDNISRAIDTTLIKKGDVIRARYHKWTEAHNGIVAAVTETEIKVLYIPDIGNVTNYFSLTAAEIDGGLWEVSWSSDLQTVLTEGGDENDA